MLQDVYATLLRNRLDPRWVRGELHVVVYGRLFMLVDRPGGVGLRTLATPVPVLFHEPVEALAAMGLGALDATG